MCRWDRGGEWRESSIPGSWEVGIEKSDLKQPGLLHREQPRKGLQGLCKGSIIITSKGHGMAAVQLKAGTRGSVLTLTASTL